MPGATCKTIFDVQAGYKLYHDKVEDDANCPLDVPAEVIYDVDNVFA